MEKIFVVGLLFINFLSLREKNSQLYVLRMILKTKKKDENNNGNVFYIKES